MQTTGKDRDIIDKFYTNPTVAKLCLEKFNELVPIKKTDILMEPAAGNGSFFNIMREYSSNVFGYDIEPDHPDIVKQDFLEFDYINPDPTKLNMYVIGNPPFGRQASLAKQFIKKSIEFATAIGFILPKSFKKDSFQSTFPRNFHLILSFDLPVESFLLNGKPYDVPCVFQIWYRRIYFREIKEVEKPDFFEYVKISDKPDLSFRRVGVYAGKIDKVCKDKSEQSHYFLKLRKDVNIDNFIKYYNENITFEVDNTTGPKSISKRELNERLQSFI